MPNNVTLRLEEGLRFIATTGSGFDVALDSRSDIESMTAPSPMELQLVALGGCTAMDVISILRKMRQDVASYEVKLTGERALEHPRVYTTVTIDHSLRGTGIGRDQVHRAIELTMARYCPVFAMLYPTVAIQERFQITDEGSGATIDGVVEREDVGKAAD
jgi:putative redox protein